MPNNISHKWITTFICKINDHYVKYKTIKMLEYTQNDEYWSSLITNWITTLEACLTSAKERILQKNYNIYLQD